MRGIEGAKGGWGSLSRGRWNMKGGQECSRIGLGPGFSLASPGLVTDWLYPLRAPDPLPSPDLPEGTPWFCEAPSSPSLLVLLNP